MERSSANTCLKTAVNLAWSLSLLRLLMPSNTHTKLKTKLWSIYPPARGNIHNFAFSWTNLFGSLTLKFRGYTAYDLAAKCLCLAVYCLVNYTLRTAQKPSERAGGVGVRADCVQPIPGAEGMESRCYKMLHIFPWSSDGTAKVLSWSPLWSLIVLKLEVAISSSLNHTHSAIFYGRQVGQPPM